jgi:hypothetical protein
VVSVNEQQVEWLASQKPCDMPNYVRVV